MGVLVSQLGLSKEQISDNDSFVDDLGADSLDSIEVVMACEEEFGISIDEGELDSACDVSDGCWEGELTVGRLRGLIEKKLAEAK